MSTGEYLIDTNILIYHTKGSQPATALLNNLKLVTKNVDDFKGIEGLEIENPFK